MLLVLLVLAATQADAKTWIDAECGLVLTSQPDGYTYQSLEGETFCKIKSWPFDSDTATLQCDNGSTLAMQFVGDQEIVLNNISMMVYDGPIPCGDHDGESPD